MPALKKIEDYEKIGFRIVFYDSKTKQQIAYGVAEMKEFLRRHGLSEKDVVFVRPALPPSVPSDEMTKKYLVSKRVF